MEKVIIIGFTAKSDGIVLETNIPAKLKTGKVKLVGFLGIKLVRCC